MEHTLQRLGSYKVRSLQHIALLAGLPSTGTKSQLIQSLTTQLPRPRLPSFGGRVLSVDMGIRNLAFCVLDIPKVEDHSAIEKTSRDVLQVTAWRRLDVLEATNSVSHNGLKASDGEAPSRESSRGALPSNEAFTPSNLAKTAFGITKDLLSYNPTTILLERQRHRSAGSSAIQEWTVRVNMLESMIWACLETHNMLQRTGIRSTFPTCHEVSPKRVARFWTAGDGTELSYSGGDIEQHALRLKDAQTPRLRRKIDKKEKIDVVRLWLRGEGKVALTFTPDTQHIADAFTKPSAGRRRRAGVVSSDSSVVQETKLDDLSDCLLQGAAMVRWERNRQNLWRSLDDAVLDKT